MKMVDAACHHDKVYAAGHDSYVGVASVGLKYVVDASDHDNTVDDAGHDDMVDAAVRKDKEDSPTYVSSKIDELTQVEI